MKREAVYLVINPECLWYGQLILCTAFESYQGLWFKSPMGEMFLNTFPYQKKDVKFIGYL